MNKPLDIEPGDRILISRTDRLGDLILALPFVETMKSRYPKCRIDVLASLYASPILEHNSAIDRILRVQNDQLLVSKPYKKDLLHKIKLADYSVVVVLYPERQISSLFYKAGIPIRIGTGGRFHSVFFNHHLMHTRKVNLKHESEYNLDFLRFFRHGYSVSHPVVYLREKEVANARRILGDAGVNGSFVLLHPGSGGSAERWPLERFVRLSRCLVDRGIKAVVSGSDPERIKITEMAERLNIPVICIAGETDLRTLAAVLSLASVVVANSTGPLHLAVAVGTSVVGLFPGKRIMSPVRWGPLGRHDRVMQPNAVKCHCPPKQCQCMATIDVEQVFAEVQALLERAPV